MAFGTNKLGVHALCWVGGWSEAEARRAIEGTARVGYDLIEIPTLDPDAIDVGMTRRLLEEYGLAGTLSLGFTRATCSLSWRLSLTALPLTVTRSLASTEMVATVRPSVDFAIH